MQPFIRGQIVFYDAIDADQDKPTKENYEWMIGEIIKTYKSKGSNLEEFNTMELEAQRMEIESMQNINYNVHNNRSHHNASSESIVFGQSSKQEMSDENVDGNDEQKEEQELTQQTSALSMDSLRQQRNRNNLNQSNEPSSVSPQAGNCDTINLTV